LTFFPSVAGAAAAAGSLLGEQSLLMLPEPHHKFPLARFTAA
jgi:hypothetical protein